MSDQVARQGDGDLIFWGVVAALFVAGIVYACWHAEVTWGREQHHCKTTGGVWLEGRELHKCIYGNNLRDKL